MKSLKTLLKLVGCFTVIVIHYFLYAFDKDAVKKQYLKNSTLKRKRKIYIN